MAEKKEKLKKEKPVKEKKVNAKVRMIVFLVEAAVFITGVVLSIVFINNYNDPQRVAESYFDAVVEGDYAKAYSYLEVEEAPFLNLDTYAAMMQSYADDMTDDYSVEAGRRNNYSIESGRFQRTVKVVEQDEKRFLIFKDYKVQLQDDYLTDVTFVAEKGLTLKLNGVVLDGSNTTEETDAYVDDDEQAYVINQLFAGNYVLEVSGDLRQTYTETYEMDADSFYSTYYVNVPPLKAEVIQAVADQGVEDVHAMYQAAMNGEESCEVLNAYKEKSGVDTEALDSHYEYLLDNMTITDGFFESMNMHDFNGYVYNYYTDSNTGYFTLNIDVNYTCDFQYQKLHWSGNYYEQEESYGNGSADLYYIYQDGEWVLSDMYLSPGIYIW